MTPMTDTAAQAAIGAAARELHLPTVRTEAVRLGEIAERNRLSYLAFAGRGPLRRGRRPRRAPT
jgi:hypothetical protein